MLGRLKFIKASMAMISLISASLITTLTTSVHAAPPAKAFGELPVAYDAAISPDGKHIAVVLNVDGNYGVIVKKLKSKAGEKPTLISLGDGVYPGYVKWVNNKRWVTSVRQLEKSRNIPFTMTYLFSQDIETLKGGIVVKPKNIFRQFNDTVIDWLEDDPDHILMAYSDKQFDPYPDIKKVNVETRRDKTILRGKNGVEYWMTDDDGTPHIGWGQNERGVERMIIFDAATENWDSVDDYPGLETDTSVYGILKDGTELVIGDYQGKDTMGLYIYNLDQKKITRKLFHNDNFDASGVILSKDGESVIGAKYIAEESEVELLDEYSTLLDDLRAKFTDYTVRFVDQTQDGRTVLVKMSAPYDPGGLYIYSYGDEFPSELSVMYRGLDPDDLGNVMAVRYTSRDGEKIPAFVTLPPSITSNANLKDVPFIVLPHGGPYARDAKRFDYFAQFFASRGYGVLQMNFRGSEGYGKSFADAGRSNWVVMQEDVEDGARWLLKKGYADPKRLCIAGWSYGGYAALMGVATDPELYQCAIAMAALTDIEDAKRDLKKYRGGKQAAKTFFGEAFEDKELRRANSPVRVADQIKVPVFLAHGDKDINVQFDQFTRMKRSMDKAGVEATYLKFEDEDHYLSRQENREKFFVEMEKFLLNVNGSSEFMTP